MQISASFEIADDNYEVTADSVTFGSPPTFDDPGDGGEVEVADTVEVTKADGTTSSMSYNVFLEVFAADRKVSIPSTVMFVESMLMEAAIDASEECVHDEFDVGGDS